VPVSVSCQWSGGSRRSLDLFNHRGSSLGQQLIESASASELSVGSRRSAVSGQPSWLEFGSATYRIQATTDTDTGTDTILALP
jgi:hypothetical protein